MRYKSTPKVRGHLKKITKKAFDDALSCYTYGSGIKALEQLSRRYPALKKDPENLVNLGLLYDHAAMNAKGSNASLEKNARFYYQEALKIDRRFYSAWWGLGRIYWHNKDRRALPLALKAYRLSKNARSSDAGQYAQNIGLIYKAIGNAPRAEYWLKRGTEESRKEWGVYYNLMRFYLEGKPNKQKAKELARKVRALLKKEKRSSPWLRDVRNLTEKTISSS